ncbi:MAG: SDR family NAD(P)-dependent oxidoreductase [Paracoccus sp. (in: a-proteobacteria)]
MSKNSFRNKHVVATGGNSGLGLALARALAGEGARLTLVARNAERLAAAALEIQAEHPGVVIATRPLDVTDEAATRVAMDAIAKAQGGIDALVNNAGIMHEGYFEEIPSEAFRQVMDVNYFGVLNATRAALPHLRAAQGRLINVASIGGMIGAFGYTPYCPAKYALIGLSGCLRYELEPMGIKVQVVCPAEFDSPMVDALDANRTPENRAHVLTIPKASVEAIVTDVMKGLATDRYEIVPTRLARATVKLSRLAPSLVRRTGDRAIAKVYRGPAGA